MDKLQAFIASPEYSPATLEVPYRRVPGLDRLVGLTQNTDTTAPGNNDAVEYVGDAFVNYGILNVIMKFLDSVKTELAYDDVKLCGCIHFLYLKLTSNDILSRIDCKIQELTDSAGERVLGTSHRNQTSSWLSASRKTRAPKVYADFFEAKTWLTAVLFGPEALSDHLSVLLLPLLPSTLSMFEDAYNSASRPECFTHLARSHREGNTADLNPDHARLLCDSIESSSEELTVAVSRFGEILEGEPPIAYNQQGRIQGRYKHLQLLGHATLRYYIVKALDASFPIYRSAIRGVSHFQTVICRLAACDPCLSRLAALAGMDIKPPEPLSLSLIARCGAELFLASVALLSMQDPEGLGKVLNHLSQRLITMSHDVLLQFQVSLPPVVVPCDPNYVNRIPRISELEDAKRALKVNADPLPSVAKSSSQTVTKTRRRRRNGPVSTFLQDPNGAQSSSTSRQLEDSIHNDTTKPADLEILSAFTFQYPSKQ